VENVSSTSHGALAGRARPAARKSRSFLILSSVLPVRADDRIDYQKQVKPILAERCVACHGALKQQGGLRLDTAALRLAQARLELAAFDVGPLFARRGS
jgi:mono/diheme cytochrome c family protein